MGCFVRGGKNGMGCFVRGDKNCMGCFVRGGKLMRDVLSRLAKNGMGCFVLGCFVLHSKLAMCNLKFQRFFKMFLDVWDVRLEISAVSTDVNLNGLSVHVKNRIMENRSVHWF